MSDLSNQHEKMTLSTNVLGRCLLDDVKTVKTIKRKLEGQISTKLPKMDDFPMWLKNNTSQKHNRYHAQSNVFREKVGKSWCKSLPAL